MSEAKAFKIKNAVPLTTINYGYSIFSENESIAIVKTEEMAQRIAAALNFFDTVMGALKETVEPPDKFSEYIVAGSWIGKIGYDYEKNKLRIWKLSERPVDGPYGDCFTYLNVPVEVWSALVSAPSVGVTYNNLVRGKYELEK